MKLDAIDFPVTVLLPGSSIVTRIYALITPTSECQGLCQEACGPVLMSAAEERRIIQRTGIRPRAG